MGRCVCTFLGCEAGNSFPRATKRLTYLYNFAVPMNLGRLFAHLPLEMILKLMNPIPISQIKTDQAEHLADSQAEHQADLELLAQIKARDTEALHAMYLSHHAGLYRFLRLTLAREEAEEVVQDVFVMLWNKPNQFAGRSSVRSWLYGIAKNMCRGHLRGRKTHLELNLELLEGDASHSPQARAFEEVLSAVKHLPQREQQVIELVYLGELSLQETATLLKIPLGTVKSRLNSALGRLKDWLVAEQGEHDV
jgi:RNA polymerase sigma-70 factor, ECF subfamily